MAGTDRRKSRAAAHVEKGAPAVILVRPQLGENIGTAARAMLNCGLSDLRLVEPRRRLAQRQGAGRGPLAPMRC